MSMLCEWLNLSNNIMVDFEYITVKILHFLPVQGCAILTCIGMDCATCTEVKNSLPEMASKDGFMHEVVLS